MNVSSAAVFLTYFTLCCCCCRILLLCGVLMLGLVLRVVLEEKNNEQFTMVQTGYKEIFVHVLNIHFCCIQKIYNKLSVICKQ